MKISTRKELLKEADMTLAKLRESLKEGNRDTFNDFIEGINSLIDEYVQKKKSLSAKLKALRNSIFSDKAALALANKIMIGKTQKDIQPNLLSAPGLNEPIRKVRNAEFTISSYTGDLYDSLGFSLTIELESGRVVEIDLGPRDLFY